MAASLERPNVVSPEAGPRHLAALRDMITATGTPELLRGVCLQLLDE